MRRATKGNRDATEKAIVEVLEAHGWQVAKCSAEGFPDLLCTRVAGGGGQQRWVEAKAPGGKVQLAQARLWDVWEAHCIKVYVLESAEEAKRWCKDLFIGHDWRSYPVDKRGRGAKRKKAPAFVPPRLRVRVRPGI